jgi:hypothetical protein
LSGDVLPLVSLALGQNIHPNLLDKLYHLQFGLHPAPSDHYPANTLLRRKKFQTESAYSFILFPILQEEHETIEGGDAFAEFVQMLFFVLIQLVQHAQFPEVMHK